MRIKELLILGVAIITLATTINAKEQSFHNKRR